jgi:hypothetical protein
MLKTSHEWIRKLAAESMAIAQMQLEIIIPNIDLDADAFNLANCDAHCRLISRAIDELTSNNFSSNKDARDLLCNLIKKNTYGTFAELAAYEWLIRCHVRITTQVKMTSSDVLSENGSTLDGKINHNNTYFDVKAFGFNGQLARRLKERLEEEITDEQVFIEESWDISIEKFSELIESAPRIAVDLRRERMLQFGRLRIRLETKKPVSVSSHIIEPYCLAKENALYPFKFAKQFTRNNPFILIFVIHPWFNNLSIHDDFAGTDTTFTRSLARRAFMQFTSDSTPVNSICDNVPSEITFADASHLLSAIFFVNVWPLDADPNMTYRLPSWLYLNPRARHRITRQQVRYFQDDNPHGTYIDDFVEDDY